MCNDATQPQAATHPQPMQEQMQAQAEAQRVNEAQPIDKTATLKAIYRRAVKAINEVDNAGNDSLMACLACVHQLNAIIGHLHALGITSGD